jgi:hypothetical protein
MDMAPFTEVLRVALDNLLFQFRGMTAGVTGGYEEVARTIVRLSDALDTNNTTMGELSVLLPYLRGGAEEGDEEAKGSDDTSRADVTPARPTAHPFYTPGRAPTVATEDGKDDDLDTAPADDEAPADGTSLTPAQRTAIKIRAAQSMERGAKYTNPADAAAAMIASIEAAEYSAITTRGVRRNAFLTILLEKGIELRNRLPEDVDVPEFDDSLGHRNMARFRAFLEFLEPGSRGSRAVADVLSSSHTSIIAQQTKVALACLMERTNRLPRKTPAAARVPSSASHSRASSASGGIDLFADADADAGADEHKAT